MGGACGEDQRLVIDRGFYFQIMTDSIFVQRTINSSRLPHNTHFHNYCDFLLGILNGNLD